MPWRSISVRPEPDADNPVHQRQTRPLQMHLRVKGHLILTVRSVARSCNRGLDHHWATQLLGSGRDIQGVKPVNKLAVLIRIRHDVERTAGRIDYRRAGHSDFASRESVVRDHPRGNARYARSRVDEAHLPEWC